MVGTPRAIALLLPIFLGVCARATGANAVVMGDGMARERPWVCVLVEAVCADEKLLPIAYSAHVAETLQNATPSIGTCASAAFVFMNATYGDDCAAMRATEAARDETTLHDRARDIVRARLPTIMATARYILLLQEEQQKRIALVEHAPVGAVPDTHADATADARTEEARVVP